MTDPLSALQKQRVLQALALHLMETGTRSFTLDEGGRYIADRLGRVAVPELSAADFLKRVEDHCGLLVQRETGIYEFAHKSFQEYLAAVEVEDAGLSEYLLDKLADPAWGNHPPLRHAGQRCQCADRRAAAQSHSGEPGPRLRLPGRRH